MTDRELLEEILKRVTSTETAVGDLRSRTERLETSVGKLETSVGKLETKVEKLETSVGKLETKVEKLETSVGKLETSVGKLETRVGELETDVKEMKKDILEVKVTQEVRVLPGLSLLAEGHENIVEHIQEKIDDRADRLQDSIDVLNIAVRYHSEDIQELKRAQ